MLITGINSVILTAVFTFILIVTSTKVGGMYPLVFALLECVVSDSLFPVVAFYADTAFTGVESYVYVDASIEFVVVVVIEQLTVLVKYRATIESDLCKFFNRDFFEAERRAVIVAKPFKLSNVN